MFLSSYINLPLNYPYLLICFDERMNNEKKKNQLLGNFPKK